MVNAEIKAQAHRLQSSAAGYYSRARQALTKATALAKKGAWIECAVWQEKSIMWRERADIAIRQAAALRRQLV
jgi:hypothetical protein